MREAYIAFGGRRGSQIVCTVANDSGFSFRDAGPPPERNLLVQGVDGCQQGLCQDLW